MVNVAEDEIVAIEKCWFFMLAVSVPECTPPWNPRETSQKETQRRCITCTSPWTESNVIWFQDSQKVVVIFKCLKFCYDKLSFGAPHPKTNPTFQNNHGHQITKSEKTLSQSQLWRVKTVLQPTFASFSFLCDKSSGLRIFSMYTGWGISEMVTHAVQSELKRLGIEIEHLSGEKIKKNT